MIYAVLFENDEQYADKLSALMQNKLAILDKSAHLIHAAGPLQDDQIEGDQAAGARRSVLAIRAPKVRAYSAMATGVFEPSWNKSG